MVPEQPRLIPELQFYAESFMRKAKLNINQPDIPVTIDRAFLGIDNSFIRLLFDEEWPMLYDHYTFLFTPVNRNYLPQDILMRLMLYPTTGTCLLCTSDSTGGNVFNLQEDDYTMLDELLKYKLTDSTSEYHLTIDYDSLTTDLSKLIYIYLDIKVNHSYQYYREGNPISKLGDILTNVYEVFVGEFIFEYISNLGT
jgi:hypothetical protein